MDDAEPIDATLTAPTEQVPGTGQRPMAEMEQGSARDRGDSVARAGSERHAPPHRLRDLDRRGRLWALAFALVLLLAPVQAYLQLADDWAPHGDPARMAVQTLAVGTTETPLTGQPSTSGQYVDAERHVDHLGPLHFYLMAGPVRALGPHTGMLATSVVIVGACALLSAWAAFRRLGPGGGVVAAVIIGLTMFTTGTPTLTIPVSSNIAGYPLFCATVLLWCVLRGDLRLLPLAAAATTFAAQQHLSVVPAIAVLTPAAVAGLLWHWGRHGRWRDTGARHELARWTAAALLVSLILWSPVLLQEATGDPGNLSNLVELTGDEERPTLGATAGLRQVVNVLSPPPLLGRTDLHGASGPVFLGQASLATGLSAASVVALLGLLAWHWRRCGRPEHQSLVTMVGVTSVAGAVNGATALDGIEALRLVFYHWVWPLTFFVTLALTLGAGEFLHRGLRAVMRYVTHRWADALHGRRQLTDRAVGAGRPVLAGVAVLAIAVPAAVNPRLDRPTNDFGELRTPVERAYLTRTVDQILTHRDRFDGPLLVLEEGAGAYQSIRESTALYLIDAGIDVRLPEEERWYVPDSRLAEPHEVTGGLLIVQNRTLHETTEPAGELLADVRTVDETWPRAVEQLATEVEQGPIEFGSDIRARLDLIPDSWLDLAERGELDEVEGHVGARLATGSPEEIDQIDILSRLNQLPTRPRRSLRDVAFTEFLIDHPLRRPRIDPGILDQLRAALPDERYGPDHPARLRVYLLDRADLGRYLPAPTEPESEP